MWPGRRGMWGWGWGVGGGGVDCFNCSLPEIVFGVVWRSWCRVLLNLKQGKKKAKTAIRTCDDDDSNNTNNNHNNLVILHLECLGLIFHSPLGIEGILCRFE